VSEDARNDDAEASRHAGTKAARSPFKDGYLRRRPSVWSRVNARLDRYFVDREIFVRGEDRVRYLRVSGRSQKVAVLASIGVAFWLAVATTGIGLQQVVLADRSERIEEQQLAYLELMTEISDYHGQFTRITADLEANQKYLLDLLQEDGLTSDKLAGIEDGLAPTDEAEERIAMARESLRDRLQSFESELQDIAQRNESLQAQVANLRATLHASRAEREQIDSARARLNQRLSTTEAELQTAYRANGELEEVISGLRAGLSNSKNKVSDLKTVRKSLEVELAAVRAQVAASRAREANLDGRLDELSVALRSEIERNNELRDERNRMAAQLVGAFGQMGELREQQQALLSRLNDRTARSVDALEQALAMTGIDIEDLVTEMEEEVRTARLEATGDIQTHVGGPYLPASLAGPPDPHADRLEATYSLLEQRLDRWDAIKALFEVVPVAAPMREYRLSSGFGTRKDPMNGKRARHEGLDLVGAYRAPILATAPGKVVYAGWKGAYGRVVEIDHGYGFTTRFAHMRRVDVEVGDQVGFGQQIGQMGNSGRSTGAHLHYEIRFQDRPYDPANFLKAGRHVFKG
jgi:murein DD-endopeptidase MepM/ murein hydrolase activator NlpD